MFSKALLNENFSKYFEIVKENHELKLGYTNFRKKLSGNFA